MLAQLYAALLNDYLSEVGNLLLHFFSFEVLSWSLREIHHCSWNPTLLNRRACTMAYPAPPALAGLLGLLAGLLSSRTLLPLCS